MYAVLVSAFKSDHIVESNSAIRIGSTWTSNNRRDSKGAISRIDVQSNVHPSFAATPTDTNKAKQQNKLFKKLKNQLKRQMPSQARFLKNQVAQTTNNHSFDAINGTAFHSFANSNAG